MSRVRCPNCNIQLVATTQLLQREWSDIGSYKQRSQAKFNHALAVKLYKGGLSIAAIARQCGVTAPAVAEILKKKGVK